MRKRILKPKRINLDLLYLVASANPDDNLNSKEFEEEDYYDYDSEEEYKNSEKKKIIPDGETAFFSAIKNGEDW